MTQTFDPNRSPSTHRVVCDQTGRICNAEDTVEQWDGLRVWKGAADRKHPVLYPVSLPVTIPVKNPRPVMPSIILTPAEAWAKFNAE